MGAALLVPTAHADGPALTCATACVVDVDVPADGLAVPTTTVRLVLPNGYGLEGKRYPVVYLLHGVGDGYERWVEKTDIEEFVASTDLDVIVVMPDGGGDHSEPGWYSDWADGSRQWESYHIRRLIPWVDSHLDTLATREHRAVMGLSMGGFGALSYAGRHPHLFSAAASFSGLVDPQHAGPVTSVGMTLAHGRFGTPDRRVWGHPVTRRGEWAAHNPAAIARNGGYEHLAGNLWITTGTGTPGGPAGDDPGNAGAYAVEQFIWQTNQTFKAAMATSATAYHDYSYVGGPHDWAHWQYALHLVLPEVVTAIS